MSFLTVVVAAQYAFADCSTAACKEAMRWKTNFTAFLLADDGADRQAGYQAIQDAGTKIAIETDRVILGWLEPAMAARLRHVRGIADIFVGPHTPGTRALPRDEGSRAALRFHDKVMTGAWGARVEAGLAAPGNPLINCVGEGPEHAYMRVPITMTSTVTKDKARRLSPKPLYGLLPPYHITDMRGRVNVNVFILESDGTIDADLYTWTNDEIHIAQDEVVAGFTWWSDQAAQRNIALSFRPELYGGIFPSTTCPIHYEPITHVSTDDYLWINDALTFYGWGVSPVTADNVYNRLEQFNDSSKNHVIFPGQAPFDQAYSVFIADNPPPAPDRFSDNGLGAYVRFLGGPYAQVLRNSVGWGISGLDRVVAHESGHIFWACDEYAGGCSYCDECVHNAGPHPNVSNGNCDANVGTCLNPKVPCMMKVNSYALCPFTPAQIGW